jgi:hypothetical protein
MPEQNFDMSLLPAYERGETIPLIGMRAIGAFEDALVSQSLPPLFPQVIDFWQYRTRTSDSIKPAGYNGSILDMTAARVEEPYDHLTAEKLPSVHIPRDVLANKDWYIGHTICYRLQGQLHSTGNGRLDGFNADVYIYQRPPIKGTAKAMTTQISHFGEYKVFPIVRDANYEQYREVDRAARVIGDNTSGRSVSKGASIGISRKK